MGSFNSTVISNADQIVHGSGNIVATKNIGISANNVQTTSADVRIGSTEIKYDNLSPDCKVWFRNIDTPSQFFSGRDFFLKKLHTTLERCSLNRKYEHRIVVLYGLGGIGKTQIVREYVDSRRNFTNGTIISNVACFDAKNSTSLTESFAKFATVFLPNLKQKKDKSMVPAQVYKYFAEKKIKSLLIFDNAQQMRNDRRNDLGINKFLPKMDLPDDYRPLILVTSRHKNWDVPSQNIIHVTELSPTEAMNFIRKRLEQKLDRNLCLNEEIVAKKLANIHQGFPLPLSLAVNKILEDSSDKTDFHLRITTYMQGMNDPNADWMKSEHSHSDMNGYEPTMEDVWKQTMDTISLRKQGEVSGRLLSLMSYLNPSLITNNAIFSLLKFSSSLNTTPHHEIQTCLDVLQENAIIAYEDNENAADNAYFWIRIHELVQRCQRDSLHREDDYSDFFDIFKSHQQKHLVGDVQCGH